VWNERFNILLYTERNSIAEASKNLKKLDIVDLKIMLLSHQNNYFINVKIII